MEHSIKRPWSEKIYIGAVYVILIGSGILCLFPFLNVLAKSLSANWAIISGKVGLLPVAFTMENVMFVLRDRLFQNAFLISVFVTVVGSLGAVLFTAVSAYPLSKKHLPGIKFILLLYIFTMLFNGGLVPTYLLIKNLHLMDNLASLILPALINVFNLLLMKNYYESLPESLEESAKLDGASNLRIVLSIVIPISAPVFATISLFYAVYFWSNWFHPMLYLNDPSLKPLQLYLRDIILQASDENLLNQDIDALLNLSPEGIRNATIIVSTIPILLVYPMLQKYFIKGILIGSVKG
ncbi:sugar ABC transporter permease [Cohnella sp. CIP 111063]|uniref:carbohydrate ABC transporter permease n=1 Tax=unclassified Cohnella TaxID=2636738 RepID=UPI000B8BD375|nr:MULTISPECIES: carbohydrate ABC transporter permease [unclassified Cohnella]OXS54530.1 sugar ABC transporter permease [Cohnella sp. CIP 111063]PRX64038.1 carbohydrate ABC transporter membrane protein 2 (CUT1 family) [Cohnella sp. SGD-V74]